MVFMRIVVTACVFSGCVMSVGWRASAQNGAGVERSISEDIWNVDQDALLRLMRIPGPRADTRARPIEGEPLPDDYPVQDVPHDVLERLATPTNPYSALPLRFYSSQNQIALLLPLSRRVVKVYDFRAPGETSVHADESARAQAVSRAPNELTAEHPGAPAAPEPFVPSTLIAPMPQAGSAAQLATDPVREAAVARPAPLASSQPPGPRPDEISTFIGRADESRRRGDIMVMRLFLERAASLGSQEAKYRLAETYDEKMLRQWGARGVRPDPARAEALYRESGIDRAEAARAAQKRP
jgi:hypothetical protein